MITGILGRKVGMTQVFETDGTVVPATVIQAGPCVVVQAKTVAADGYEAVQLGLVDPTPAKANKPTVGHFKFGQWKQPFSMEPATSFRELMFMERSLARACFWASPRINYCHADGTSCRFDRARRACDLPPPSS